MLPTCQVMVSLGALGPAPGNGPYCRRTCDRYCERDGLDEEEIQELDNEDDGPANAAEVGRPCFPLKALC